MVHQSGPPRPITTHRQSGPPRPMTTCRQSGPPRPMTTRRQPGPPIHITSPIPNPIPNHAAPTHHHTPTHAHPPTHATYIFTDPHPPIHIHRQVYYCMQITSTNQIDRDRHLPDIYWEEGVGLCVWVGVGVGRSSPCRVVVGLGRPQPGMCVWVCVCMSGCV